MDDKKVTQSITLIGGFFTMLLQSLIGFDIVPEGGLEPGTSIVDNAMEFARNVFALVTLYGVRRKLGEGGS